MAHTVIEMVGQSTEGTPFPFNHALFYSYLLSLSLTNLLIVVSRRGGESGAREEGTCKGPVYSEKDLYLYRWDGFALDEDCVQW